MPICAIHHQSNTWSHSAPHHRRTSAAFTNSSGFNHNSWTSWSGQSMFGSTRLRSKCHRTAAINILTWCRAKLSILLVQLAPNSLRKRGYRPTFSQYKPSALHQRDSQSPSHHWDISSVGLSRIFRERSLQDQWNWEDCGLTRNGRFQRWFRLEQTFHKRVLLLWGQVSCFLQDLVLYYQALTWDWEATNPLERAGKFWNFRRDRRSGKEGLALCSSPNPRIFQIVEFPWPRFEASRGCCIDTMSYLKEWWLWFLFKG